MKKNMPFLKKDNGILYFTKKKSQGKTDLRIN